MNKETFKSLVIYRVPRASEPHNDDRIYSRRFSIDNYDYDYSHAIVKYMEACGCVIKRTEWNDFGGFYVYYLRPTKYVSPEEFLETYKPGKHFTTGTVKLFKFFTFLFVLIIVLFVIAYFKHH